ncbi:hypothetical protein BJ165DRAFT_819822 [Panaeolus papilionaceus]|nr:hypothetical protein BJ165DRAFT_819822 [Panaeolus papilionaceus]
MVMQRSPFDTCLPIATFSPASVASPSPGSGVAQKATHSDAAPTGHGNLGIPTLVGDRYQQRFSSLLTTTSTCAVPVPSAPATSSKATRQADRNASKLANVSEFRPPVPAAKRLALWSSPYARRRKLELASSIPDILVEKTYQAVEEALALSTRMAYGSGLLRFHQFCDAFDISEEARMPASAPLLASFVAHCRGSYEGKTISTWLSGVRYWHVFNQAQWNGEDDCKGTSDTHKSWGRSKDIYQLYINTGSRLTWGRSKEKEVKDQTQVKQLFK